MVVVVVDCCTVSRMDSCLCSRRKHMYTVVVVVVVVS